jgi:hypothetical protein
LNLFYDPKDLRRSENLYELGKQPRVLQDRLQGQVVVRLRVASDIVLAGVSPYDVQGRVHNDLTAN